jgi:hypothetical protein
MSSAVTWRERLRRDPSEEAFCARAALRSLRWTYPSYYDRSNDEAYELAREQTAKALWVWRCGQ